MSRGSPPTPAGRLSALLAVLPAGSPLGASRGLMRGRQSGVNESPEKLGNPAWGPMPRPVTAECWLVLEPGPLSTSSPLRFRPRLPKRSLSPPSRHWVPHPEALLSAGVWAWAGSSGPGGRLWGDGQPQWLQGTPRSPVVVPGVPGVPTGPAAPELPSEPGCQRAAGEGQADRPRPSPRPHPLEREPQVSCP